MARDSSATPPEAEYLGQAPVHDLHFAEAADHDVGRFQVAVDHPTAVSIGDGSADLLVDRDEPGQIVIRSVPRVEQAGQRAALDELHAEVRAPVGKRPDLVNGNDAWMLELTGDLCFLQEPPQEVGLVLVPFEQNLHRQVPAKVGIPALQDRAHTAASDLAQEFEPAIC